MHFRRRPAAPRGRLRKRVLLLYLIVALASAGIAFIGYQAFRIHRGNIHVDSASFAVWTRPRRGERILIFSPHCDDETLGLSALMQQAKSVGAAVRVVFITNGDGFPFSARRYFEKLRIGPDDYVRLGSLRQKEALAALHVSGVEPDEVTFLGYPDGGMASLWLHFWPRSRLYTSPQTGHDHSPYPNSQTPHAPYCGASVLADVTRAIREFRPTHVYCPHPSENHPDHWATYAFVTDALWNLAHSGAKGWKPPVQALYLIHRGDWPAPQGYHPQYDLPPPSGLVNQQTAWYRLPVSGRDEDVKHDAVSKYVSQTQVMGRFLDAFVRTNELVGIRLPGPLTRVPPGKIHIDGDLSDWKRIPESVGDPSGDSLPVEVSGAGDVVSVTACEDASRLYVKMEMRNRISPRVEYDVYWHAMPDEPLGTRGAALRLNQPPPPGVHAAAVDNVWEVSLQRPKGRAVFLGVATQYHGYVVDKSGWRVLMPG